MGKRTPRRDLLTRSRHTDDNRLAPPLVTRLQRRAHNINIARAVKRIIAASIGHLNELLLDALAAELSRVDKVGRAELLAPRLLGVVHVDDDDAASLLLGRALDDGQTDAAGAEDGDVGARFDAVFARRDDGGAVSGRDAAAEETCAVHGRFVRDGHDGDVGYDCVLREGGCAHEVEEVLALALEARGAVRHDTFALGGADLTAEVRLAGLAELAFLALRCAVHNQCLDSCAGT